MFSPVQIKPIARQPISQRIAAPIKGTAVRAKAPVFHFFNGIFGQHTFNTANTNPPLTPEGEKIS